MEIFGSLMDFLGKKKKEKQYEKEAARADEQYWKKLDAMNFDPAMPSETAPKYQQTQSPVARAYLESFLTGSNPDAIRGTSVGSGVAKADAQSRFNAAYGGWDKLRAQGRAELGNNERFQPKPITKTIVNQEAEGYARNPYLDDLESDYGTKFTPAEAKFAEAHPAMSLAIQPEGGGYKVRVGKKGHYDTLQEAMAAWDSGWKWEA
jgi:hypothetical protein